MAKDIGEHNLEFEPLIIEFKLGEQKFFLRGECLLKGDGQLNALKLKQEEGLAYLLRLGHLWNQCLTNDSG